MKPINYKGWIIQDNKYNYEKDHFLRFEYYNENDCNCPIRHGGWVDEIIKEIEYLIKEFYL